MASKGTGLVFVFAIASTLLSGLPAGPGDTLCRLEAPVRQAVVGKFPGYEVLTLAHLDAYGRGQFHMFGDPFPATALSLVKGNKAVLVVARHQAAMTWTLEQLEESDGTPAVWKEPPGEYTDVYGEKKLTVVRDGILWCGYGSWAILYGWVDGRVQKIWLAD
jgi:hypothetical protein